MNRLTPLTTWSDFAPAAIALAVVGCGEAPCEDTLTCVVADTVPTITSVSPPNGAEGLSIDTKLVVSFGEPMNQAKTQNAFASTTLTNPTFRWLDERTLEISPTNLAYAAGDRDVAAHQYDYTFTSEAEDQSGNPLATDLSLFIFSTSRRVEDELYVTEEVVQADGSAGVCFSNPGLWRVGTAGDQECRDIITVDLSSVPADADIKAAALSCSYQELVGAVPDSGTLARVQFDPSNLAAGWGATPLDTYPDPFLFSQAPPLQYAFTLGIEAALEAALADPTTTALQLRFSLESSTDSNYLVWRSLDEGGCRDGLQLTYLAP